MSLPKPAGRHLKAGQGRIDLPEHALKQALLGRPDGQFDLGQAVHAAAQMAAGLDRTDALPVAEAIKLAREPHGRLLINARSGSAAVQVRAASVTLDDGEVERRQRRRRDRPPSPRGRAAR